MAAEFTDDMDRVVAIEHLRVAGDQYPYIMQVAHGPWQCGRHIPQAAGFYQVGQLGGDEQHLLFIGIGIDHRQRGPPCRGQI